MRAWFSPLRLLAAGAILVVVFFAYGITQKSDKLLEVPDKAHSLNGIISVPGTSRTQDSGGIYYVDVVVQKASLLQSAFKLFRPEGADLISQNDFVPSGLSYSQQLQVDKETMKVSQEKASVVALRALGLKFPAREGGVRVAAIQSDSHARGVLQPQDVVVAADGHKIATRLDLFNALSSHRPGDIVRIGVLRAGKRLDFRIKTIGDSTEPRRALIGFAPIEVVDARLPVPVHFDLGRDVGGPSAGLAFALEILEQKGRDVDHGLRIAATGEIQLDGSVTPIGGVKQKTIGARRAHADAFLVPVGDNAAVAKRYAHGLRIIPVKNFQQALRALATLPRNS
jgi:PDZ domain-containing protein